MSETLDYVGAAVPLASDTEQRQRTCTEAEINDIVRSLFETGVTVAEMQDAVLSVYALRSASAVRAAQNTQQNTQQNTHRNYYIEEEEYEGLVRIFLRQLLGAGVSLDEIRTVVLSTYSLTPGPLTRAVAGTVTSIEERVEECIAANIAADNTADNTVDNTADNTVIEDDMEAIGEVAERVAVPVMNMVLFQVVYGLLRDFPHRFFAPTGNSLYEDNNIGAVFFGALQRDLERLLGDVGRDMTAGDLHRYTKRARHALKSITDYLLTASELETAEQPAERELIEVCKPVAGKQWLQKIKNNDCF